MMQAIVTNFMFQIPTGSISFTGLQSEVAGWVSAFIAMGIVYFVVKNPDSVLNSVGGIFKSIFG